ncbi:glycoside hydrolase family 3 C-terminal domain-containing protein [Tunturiibacter empetritectus]
MMNDAPGIPRLGVAAYNWWSEGLHGIARSGYATAFPQAIGVAATWDPELMGEIGAAVADEARAKYHDALRQQNHRIFYGLTIWSPNINILRDPRWGRGQETYGEDPFLTAQMAVPFIQGLQGNDSRYYKTIATPKHFAVHSGPESDRHREDVNPTAHDLWDTYLPAFRAAITEGRAGSLMCAYNSVYGEPACGSRMLLEDVLRKDWGFRGFITSDCGAIDDFFETKAHGFSPDADHAVVTALRAGTDTNCGTSYEALLSAVRRGLVGESELDVSLERLFEARMQLGMFDDDKIVPYAQTPFSEVNSRAHSELARRAARESIVLLKNEGNILPLDPEHVRSIAVIGPNAASLSALEGNYNAIPKFPVVPLDGVRAAFQRSQVLYAQGAPHLEGVALPVPETALRPRVGSEEHGLTAEYFSGDLTGKPVVTRVDQRLDFDWTAAAPVPGTSAKKFSVRWTGTIAMPRAGSYKFRVGFPECFPCDDMERFRVYLDDRLIIASEPTSPVKERPAETSQFEISFADTAPHSLKIEYQHESELFGAGFRLDWSPPPAALLDEALRAAHDADVIVAFVGLSPLLEGEEMPVKVPGFAGGDKTDLELPAVQKRLLEELGKTGKPMVVVLMNGSALAVNWAKEHAAAILEAWYPGESGGTAIGETLSGENNPAGRLPMTFYTSVADLPAFSDYSMAHRTYRYYDGKPLFPFGYGLSYTQFRYDALNLSSSHLTAGMSLSVETTVTNTGARDGDEVAELYLMPPRSTIAPRLALKGFTRVHLRSGESKQVKFVLNDRALSTVSDSGERAVEPGRYQVCVRGGQPLEDSRGVVTFTIDGRKTVPR